MGITELLDPRTSDDEPKRRPAAKVAKIATQIDAQCAKEAGFDLEDDWMVSVSP